MNVSRRAVLGLAAMVLSATVNAAPHRYDHVVIVIEENTSYEEVLGNRVDAPFFNELADGGVNFTEFYAITHPSQPNYIHLFSGDNQGVIDDTRPTSYPWTTPNLGAALLAAGATFAGYSEDLPAVGDRDTIGVDVVIGATTYKLYRRKHNPWANWQAAEGTDPIPANQLRFDTNLRLLDFPADFSQLPTLSFVIPNEQNDMHDGTIRMADDWLRAKLGTYPQWARTHNSLLVITFDEDNFSGPNRIPTIFHGAGLTPQTQNGTTWTLHNLLRTLSDMYDAAPADRAAKVRPITGVFPLDVPVLTKRWRQGLDGYAGCVDTMLRASAPTENNSGVTLLTCDLDTDSTTPGNQPAQTLIRFNGLFGNGPGQLPAGAQIISAKLIAWTGANTSDDSDNLMALHRMLVSWNANDSWNSLVNGVSANNVEAISVPSFTYQPELDTAPAVFDVSADVAAWMAGAENRGWVFLPGGADGWNFRSADNAAAVNRPVLEIAYTLPTAPGYPAWQLAKFGTNAGQPGTLPNDDPDLDGGRNLLEYALNSHPLRAGLVLDATATPSALTFFRNPAATDVTISVEATDEFPTTGWSTIATWTEAAGWVGALGFVASEIFGAVTIVDTKDSIPPDQRFFRISVTGP